MQLMECNNTISSSSSNLEGPWFNLLVLCIDMDNLGHWNSMFLVFTYIEF